MAERPEPLMLSLPRPAADVFELFQRLAVPGRPSFLLESGKGSDPYLVLFGKDRACELRRRDQAVVKGTHPFRTLAGLLRASRMPRPTTFRAGPFRWNRVLTFSPHNESERAQEIRPSWSHRSNTRFDPYR